MTTSNTAQICFPFVRERGIEFVDNLQLRNVTAACSLGVRLSRLLVFVLAPDGNRPDHVCNQQGGRQELFWHGRRVFF